MAIRTFPLVAVPLAIALVAGCHSAPKEQSTHFDAGAQFNPLFDHPTIPSSAAGDGGVVIPDGGRADLRQFCTDVYGADSARMQKKCAVRDVGIAKGLAQVASNLCADDLSAAVARGRTSFDPDAAKQCIKMLTDSDLPKTRADETFFEHFPCDRVLLGTVDDAQPCRFSVDCKDGLACVGARVGADGVCKKTPKLGDACSQQRFGSTLNEEAATIHHPECVAGAWCDGRTCQTRLTAGQACTNSLSCGTGLSCVTGKCGKLANAGGTCFQPTDCMFGMWCSKEGAGGAGHCEVKRPDGAVCTEPDACKGRCDIPKPADGGPPLPGHCSAQCGSG